MQGSRPLIRLNLSSFGQERGIFHIGAEVPDDVLYLGVTEQYLDRSYVARGTVDHCSFRPAQRVRAVLTLTQTDGGHPLVDYARILAGADVVIVIDAAREQIFMRRTAPPLELDDQRRTDLRRELELDGAVGLLLNNNHAVPKIRACNDIADLDRD